MSTYDQAVAPLEPLEAGINHLRGPDGAAVILEYGDYECPYSRLAVREIERERAMKRPVRFAYRHYPLVRIHPHALDAAAAAEAAANQGTSGTCTRSVLPPEAP